MEFLHGYPPCSWKPHLRLRSRPYERRPGAFGCFSGRCFLICLEPSFSHVQHVFPMFGKFAVFWSPKLPPNVSFGFSKPQKSESSLFHHSCHLDMSPFSDIPKSYIYIYIHIHAYLLLHPGNQTRRAGNSTIDGWFSHFLTSHGISKLPCLNTEGYDWVN